MLYDLTARTTRPPPNLNAARGQQQQQQQQRGRGRADAARARAPRRGGRVPRAQEGEATQRQIDEDT